MYEKMRLDPYQMPWSILVRTDLDFCIDAEEVLDRARDMAEDVRTHTEEVLGEPMDHESQEFDCPI